MSNFVRAVRTPVVLLGSVILVEGFFLAQRFLKDERIDLLYSALSPFQSQDFRNKASIWSSSSFPVTPPRTDLTLQTPETPFGIRPELIDGTFSYKVESGDTLTSVWKELEDSDAAIAAASKAFEVAKFDLRGLRAGETVTVTRRAGEVIEFRRELRDGATLVLVSDEVGGFAPRVEQPQVFENERTVSGTIKSSLVDASRAEDLPYSLVDDFVDLFSNRVEFRKDLQPGDTFSVVYDDRVLENGTSLAPGAIKAASLQLGGKLFAVVRDIAADGTVRYFDEKGEMPGKFFLRYPVKFTRISSVFSNARFHPVLNTSRAHNGVDFAAPTGTEVRTVGDGVVVFSGYKSSTGNMVRIAHCNRYTTEYMHLSKIDSAVKTGSKVKRGQLIGAVGSTGLSTGPHLHFGMFDNGKYIDPLKSNLLQSEESVKPPAAVLARLAELKKTHEGMTVEAMAVASVGSTDRNA